MRKGAKLIVAIIFLCAIGLGTALYKNYKLGVPLWKGKLPSVWLIEAKTSFFTDGIDPITVQLSLPNAAELYQHSDQEAGSLGFGFLTETTEEGRRAVWSAQPTSEEKSHALYYRLFLPRNINYFVSENPVIGDTPIANDPGFGGPALDAAKDLVALAKSRSSDQDSLFGQLLTLLKERQASQEILILNSYYKNEEKLLPAQIEQQMKLDLLNLAGIPARLSYGVKLEENLNSQAPVPLIEYCNGTTWKSRTFDNPTAALSQQRILVWCTGDRPLIKLFGTENSKIQFTVVKDEVPFDSLTEMKDSPFLASTILGLPASERLVFSYVVLIPVGAFVVVLMRNIIGIATLGTFMPVLLALAFLEMPLLDGLIMFTVIVAVGLYFRFLLSSMNLLVVPRVAACVVIVTMLMLLMSLISWKLGMRGVLQITVFPMIIIAWTIERMSLIWEEEGKSNAIKQVIGSLIVAILAFSLMSLAQVKYWAQYFPELLLVLLAAILLIGRYTGYRLTELMRFKNFTQADLSNQ